MLKFAFFFKSSVTIALICLLAIAAKGQDFLLDQNLPSTTLDDSSKLSLLHSRFGSRFSLSLINKDNGVHTGALGFDVDEFTELLIEVESENQKERFRTANLSPGALYLENQELDFGLTASRLSGETKTGLKISATIVSPFTPSEDLNEDEAIKTSISPVYYIILTVNNTSDKKITGKINVGLKKQAYDRIRLSSRRSWTYGESGSEVFFRDIADNKTLLALSTIEANPRSKHFEHHGFQGLSASYALEPGSASSDTLIYATHHGEQVLFDRKYNMPLRYYYTKYWSDIDEVLSYAKENATNNLRKAQAFENLLINSSASPEEKWVAALSFRNDHANCFFLLDQKNRARFYVLEGRFRHTSTIDVAHETEINALFTPWRLKLQLEQWLHYLAREEVITKYKEGEPVKEGMSAAEYGPFLYHDVGDFPYIDEHTMYDYGPHMAVEENATYALLLYWYWKLSKDDEFVKAKLGMLDMLLHSLTNRDLNGNGIADNGVGWSTYDVSEAIKRSPDNVYLGVKQMCAYVGSAEMFQSLANREKTKDANITKSGIKDSEGMGYISGGALYNGPLREKQAKRYLAEAEKIKNSLEKAYREHGYVPVSLDKNFEGWDQYSVVLGEGLMYMGLSGNQSKILKEASKYLGPTYKKAFEKSKSNYGIKLSSAEPTTWFSKIMVSDLVAHYWYGVENSTAQFTYNWNKNNPDAYNDGAHDANTSWIGYWYPRGISSLGYLLINDGFDVRDVESYTDKAK